MSYGCGNIIRVDRRLRKTILYRARFRIVLIYSNWKTYLSSRNEHAVATCPGFSSRTVQRSVLEPNQVCTVKKKTTLDESRRFESEHLNILEPVQRLLVPSEHFVSLLMFQSRNTKPLLRKHFSFPHYQGNSRNDYRTKMIQKKKISPNRLLIGAKFPVEKFITIQFSRCAQGKYFLPKKKIKK